MRHLLREAMQAGAFGFSTTTSRNHTGYGARPLACRNASREELAALCHALRDVGRGTIEIALNSAGMHPIDEADLATPAPAHARKWSPGHLAVALCPPWGPGVSSYPDRAQTGRPRRPDHAAGDAAADLHAGRLAPSVDVCDVSLPGSQPSIARWPNRSLCTSSPPSARPLCKTWPCGIATICGGKHGCSKCTHPALAMYRGKTIQEIAALQGKRPVDAYFDLAIADELQTRFQTALFNYDDGRGRAPDHGRALPDRPLRRRGPRRCPVRCGLCHRPARHLGAPTAGPDARTGRTQIDGGPGRPVWHPAARHARPKAMWRIWCCSIPPPWRPSPRSMSMISPARAGA